MSFKIFSNFSKALIPVGIVLALILTPEEAASLKSECYLKIQGISGNSTEKNHKNWIVVRSYTHGIKGVPPSSSLSRIKPARTYGKAVGGEFVINKISDSASKFLSNMNTKGIHIPEVKIEQRWMMPDKTVYMVYVMSDVKVTSVQPASSSPGDSLPTEEVSFDYSEIKWEYTETEQGEGKPSGNIETEWDVQNKNIP